MKYQSAGSSSEMSHTREPWFGYLRSATCVLGQLLSRHTMNYTRTLPRMIIPGLYGIQVDEC